MEKELTPTEMIVLIMYRKLRDKVDTIINVLKDIRSTVQPVTQVEPVDPNE